MGRFRGKGCKPFAKCDGLRKPVLAVFCDYTVRDGLSYLGFVVQQMGRKVQLSCPATSGDAEREAVELVVGSGVPSDIVYSDHADTARIVGVKYVKRNVNPAHKAARKLAGYRASPDIVRSIMGSMFGKPPPSSAWATRGGE